MSYELRVERLIDASPEEVFDAYTDPEAQKIWFTILDEGMIVENEVDLRVGGKWVSTWGLSPGQGSRDHRIRTRLRRRRAKRRHKVALVRQRGQHL